MELDELRSRMAETDRDMLVAELEDRMQDAQAGELSFVRNEGGRRVGDVDQMQVVSNVLEIRFETTTGTRDGERLVRLYFTEPVEIPDVLVALKLASKYPGDYGLEEQTGHARVAGRRGDEHVVQHGMGVPQWHD